MNRYLIIFFSFLGMMALSLLFNFDVFNGYAVVAYFLSLEILLSDIERYFKRKRLLEKLEEQMKEKEDGSTKEKD